jgi:HAD superfamily hydrolase (TIGR01509 family)
MKFEAVIFDLDGTILTNEDEYGEAFNIVLESLGTKTNEEFPHESGIGVEENWPKLIKKYDIKTDRSKEELADQTQREYFNLIKEVDLQEGFEEFAGDLKAVGIKMALATSNTWTVVEKIFNTLKIDKYFDAVVTGEEVARKKPSPDIFLRAADKLNVVPEKCVVFEDSIAGVMAAKNANMRVVGMVRDSGHKVQLKEADLLVSDFQEFLKKVDMDYGGNGEVE